MSIITALQMGDLANQISAARVDAHVPAANGSAYGTAGFESTVRICWTALSIADLKPVTMGFHRSRRLRRPSP